MNSPAIRAARHLIYIAEMSHREGTPEERAADPIRTADDGDLCANPDCCGQCLAIRALRAELPERLIVAEPSPVSHLSETWSGE